MCKFKSGIILKNRAVLAPAYNDSHSVLLRKLNIEDTTQNALRLFVRAELVPPNDDRTAPVEKWKFTVDQDMTPDWFDVLRSEYEARFRAEVADWIKETTLVAAGKAWTKIKKARYEICVLNGTLGSKQFGPNNNYAESYIREDLNSGDLLKQLKEEFGKRLLPITLDLTSLDGLKDYGKIEGDYLSLMNLDIYREHRECLLNTDPFFLATADSTPSGYGDGRVRYVRSRGSVNCGWYGDHCGVRPFFLLES